MAVAMNPISEVFCKIKTGVMGAVDNLGTVNVTARARAKAANEAARTRAFGYSFETGEDFSRVVSAYRNTGLSQEEAFAAASKNYNSATKVDGIRRSNDFSLLDRAMIGFADPSGKGGYDAWRVGGAVGVSTAAAAGVGYAALND